MTSPLSPDNWPTLYSVGRAKQNDSTRILSIILPIIFTVGIVALFTHLYLTDMSQINLLLLTLPILIVLVGILVTLRGAIVFFNSLYAPPEDTHTTSLILRRLLGVPPTPKFLRSVFRYPFVVINIKDRKFKLQDDTTYWLGGPTILIIRDGTGVYIERGNQFSRTLGPGFAFLDRFERVREIVDLRPHTMSSVQAGSPRPISARTKDGIKIKFNISIQFHILRPPTRNGEEYKNGDEESVKNSDLSPDARKILENMAKPMNPGDLNAIKKAVERTTVRYRESNYSESKWHESVWGTVSGKLAKYVTQHYLNELMTFENIARENPSRNVREESGRTPITGQLISGSVREAIREELDTELQASSGITLTDLHITGFPIPPEIYDQYRQLSDVERQTQIKRTEGTAEVDKLWVRERKHAQVQKDLISEIADAFKSIDDQNFTDSVLLSLSSILDQSLENTAIPSILAKDNLSILEQLRDFLENKDNN